MRTEEVLKKIPELKKDELYFWRKSGFIHSQVVQDGRAKRHEWDLEEVQKIQLMKELCISGLSPKEAYCKATEDFLGRIKIIAIGDAGCNILQRLNRAKVQGIRSIAVNTDAEALMTTPWFSPLFLRGITPPEITFARIIKGCLPFVISRF